MIYSSSSNTHVFPFGSGRHVHPYDHVLNEVNISNIIKTVTDQKSYLIDYDSDSHQARFVIEGYYFESVVPNINNYKNIYAVANIVDIDGYKYLSGLDSNSPNTELTLSDDQINVVSSGYLSIDFTPTSAVPLKQILITNSASETLHISTNNKFKFAQPSDVSVDIMSLNVPVGATATIELYTNTRIDAVVGNETGNFTGLAFDTSSSSAYSIKITDDNGNKCEASLLKLADTSVEVRGQSLKTILTWKPLS